MIKQLEKRLKEKANREKAGGLQRFFKTGKGEYGEGDVFLGISVPEQRKIALEFKNLNLEEIRTLLDSEVHEKRLIALLILIEKYKKADEKIKGEIFNFYLENAKRNRINNWDLVDLSSHKIVGNYLLDKERKILHDLARAGNLWEKRIAIVSTFAFIRNNEFEDAIGISGILMEDRHDLIHKAAGWMLREVGKKNKKVLEGFLKKHCKTMPRTLLRYAIEKFNEDERKNYLNIKPK